MSYHPDDTIAAIATAAGGAVRGMVRLSGGKALAVAARCFTANNAQPLHSLRQATAVDGRFRLVLDSGGAHSLPCRVYIWPTKRSYTREPIVEFYTHGSPPVLAAVLAAACRAGARLAEPGEFTLRAYLSGRLDLTQAEAVLGVVDARQKSDFDAALAQLAGGIARPLNQLRDDLLQLLAELEAGLDFVDEDIEFISRAELQRRLAAAEQQLTTVALQMDARLTSASANRVALIGPPNAGKSSLFNALVSRYDSAIVRQTRLAQPAIVSSMRGTTRDFLTATLELDGVQCELIDTAGIDFLNASVPVEATSQSMAMQQRERATLRIWCEEALQYHDCFDTASVHANRDVQRDLDIIVGTKADLLTPENRLFPQTGTAAPIVMTSTHTGEGLAELRSVLRAKLINVPAAASERVVTATADRCRESVRTARSALNRAIELVDGGGEELIAVDVRAALDELGKVVGAVYTDDLLDRIFKTFCIGK